MFPVPSTAMWKIAVILAMLWLIAMLMSFVIRLFKMLENRSFDLTIKSAWLLFIKGTKFTFGLVGSIFIGVGVLALCPLGWAFWTRFAEWVAFYVLLFSPFDWENWSWAGHLLAVGPSDWSYWPWGFVSSILVLSLGGLMIVISDYKGFIKNLYSPK